jgi:UDP-N-acetylmuramoyl-L-alanyl-D-glutamate--2,6-diaminopimelate ligase
MERVDDGSGVVAVVDYAHKPAALEGVLRTCRGLTAPGGRVVAVFGCGGDRDRGKRPEMGRIAATLADVVVITSDNPRSEDPRAIAAEIESGVLAAGGAATIVIDRATAIAEAAAGCRAGDVLLIAGKGHEQSQEVAGRKEPFDDRAVARAVLASARGRRASSAAGQP